MAKAVQDVTDPGAQVGKRSGQVGSRISTGTASSSMFAISPASPVSAAGLQVLRLLL
jgi:hypothetical protein